MVTYKDGEKWVARDSVRTIGKPKKIELISDIEKIKSNGEDLAFVTVNILDKDGRLVPTANNMLKFELSGPGEIVATDNGNPADLTSFISKKRKALNGKALVIIRVNKSAADDDEILLSVYSKDLKKAILNFDIDKTAH